jgi:hypothetical protein
MPNKWLAHAKKINGARHLKKWRAVLVGVSFSKNAMKALILLHRALKCTREIRRGHYVK